MADELDPVLESLLRSALRAEAASIPFRLRAEDVRPRVARTKGPGWGPIMLAAAIAVVGLAAGGVLLAGAFRPTPRVGPTAPPAVVTGPLSALASYDRLEGAAPVPFDHPIAHAEGLAPDDSATTIRAGEAIPWVEVIFACSGPGLSFGSSGSGPQVNQNVGPLPPIACDTGVQRLPLVWPNPDTEQGLVVNAVGGTAWRAVVTGRPLGVPERAAGTAAIPGMLSFDELRRALSPGHGPEVARGSGIGDATATVFTMPASSAEQLSLAFTCQQGFAEVALGTNDALDSGLGFVQLPCDGPPPFCVDLPDSPPVSAYSTFRVRVEPGARWEAVLVKRQGASATPAP
jgi:hypothetical protein